MSPFKSSDPSIDAGSIDKLLHNQTHFVTDPLRVHEGCQRSAGCAWYVPFASVESTMLVSYVDCALSLSITTTECLFACIQLRSFPVMVFDSLPPDTSLFHNRLTGPTPFSILRASVSHWVTRRAMLIKSHGPLMNGMVVVNSRNLPFIHYIRDGIRELFYRYACAFGQMQKPNSVFRMKSHSSVRDWGTSSQTRQAYVFSPAKLFTFCTSGLAPLSNVAT